MLLCAIHNEWDIYAVSNCLRQSVCLLCLSLTRTRTYNQSITYSLIQSILSHSWSPSVYLSCQFICLSLFFNDKIHTHAHFFNHSCARSLHHSLTHSLTHSLVLSLVLRLYTCLSIFLSFLFFCLYPSVKYAVSVSMSACLFFLSFSRFVCVQVSNISTNLFQ
jgi:hypothetical protein